MNKINSKILFINIKLKINLNIIKITEELIYIKTIYE